MSFFARLRRPERLPALHGQAASPVGGPHESGDEPLASRRAAAGQLTRIGLFWSRMAIASPTDPFHGSGKFVAAAGLSRALVRYGTIPHVDLFVPLADLKASQEQFGRMSPGVLTGETAVARLIPESDVAAQFAAYAYDVLHDPANLDFIRPVYIRSRLARRPLPITCSLMGFSYAFDVLSCFLPLLALPILPCDAIVCATQAARHAMQRRLADVAERYYAVWDRPVPPLPRLEVIPWGVDTQLFAPRDIRAARRELELPLDRPILLCNGRVRIQDKMDWTPLLLAFERVCRTLEQRPLLVLSGSNSSRYGQLLLEQAAQLGLANDVRAFFNLPPACLPSLYASCDVFLSMSDNPGETFGLTIVEAMACGRPVVASDWNGYKELIAHGETGFKVRTDWADCLGELNDLGPIVDPEHQHLHVGQSVSVDVAQLAAYVTQLLGNRQLREELGRRGRARVQELYDWPVVVAQWEGLWAELIPIARSLAATEWKAAKLDYLQPNHFQHFASYSSRVIDERIPVILTPRGKELLAGKVPLLLHPWAQGLLKPEILRGALATLHASRWLCAGLPVGELLTVLQRTQGLSRDRALMHLMWLAKYDLVSLGGQPSLPR